MKFFISISLALFGFSGEALAFEQAAAPETVGFLPNTIGLLLSGILVMFMAAGFAMLEAGAVRTKSVNGILIKNLALYAIASLTFFLCGYGIMFGEVADAYFPIFHGQNRMDSEYAITAFWFFQMVFVATAASVVSGALAERIKLIPFFLFVAGLTAFIYPTVGQWTWGGGFLTDLGFLDFAGSTIVHSVGGWAALTGAIILGARRRRFAKDGRCHTISGSSAPQVTLGVFILWFGWFGFNGGSNLSFNSTEDALALASILANTNAAAVGGVLFALVATYLLYRKFDIATTLNGALAGLVAITAEPLLPSLGLATLIGAAGAFVMILANLLLVKFKIDDVVGAIPVHLAAGIFGTLMVSFSNPDASFLVQLTGVLVVGVFVSATSAGLWAVLRRTIGIRMCPREEVLGADACEVISIENPEALSSDFEPEFYNDNLEDEEAA